GFPALPSPPRPRILATLLLFGMTLAIGAWLATLAIPRPAVGLIRLETDIWSLSAWLVKQEIIEARNNPQIKAIVLIIDSPGGEVAPTQDIFLEVLSLREEMPVVGSINGLAASGGYYLALATDPLYAKPSSTVGNIGVWGFVPSQIGVNEQVLASGPFKLTASNPETFLREIEGIKQEFILTTQAQRGDRLTITPTEISQGLAYPGRVALQYGLIDALASQADAEAEAARLAGVVNYEVIDLEEIVVDRLLAEANSGSAQGAPPVLIPSANGGNTLSDEGQPTPAGAGTDPLWFFQPWLGAADPLTGRRTLPPGIYLLYDVSVSDIGGGEK
ncbi:MAG TPA: S49 family peptidase, partial [Anaerolineales bacterium]|nr:S49 family peptidase [Anaerolineales bacterium]